MNKEELKILIDHINSVADNVPRGLSSLKDALSFAIMDLAAYYRFGSKLKDYEKALAFAQSIPSFTDFESEEFSTWLLNDQQHLKYMPF